jgi:hypothetical protein
VTDLGGEEQRFLRELVDQLQSRGPDGDFRVPDEQVKDLMAFMILGAMAAGDDRPLEPAEEATLLEFGMRVGISGGETAEQVQQAIAAYVASQPLDESVARAAESAARGLAREGGKAVGEAFARFVDSSRKLQPLEQGARPAGTVAAGPAARFQLLVPAKGKAPKKKPKSKRRR